MQGTGEIRPHPGPRLFPGKSSRPGASALWGPAPRGSAPVTPPPGTHPHGLLTSLQRETHSPARPPACQGHFCRHFRRGGPSVATSGGGPPGGVWLGFRPMEMAGRVTAAGAEPHLGTGRKKRTLELGEETGKGRAGPRGRVRKGDGSTGRDRKRRA